MPCTHTFSSSQADEIEWWHGVPILLLVAFITGGRLALLRLWPSYKAASDQSNQMVSLHPRKLENPKCSNIDNLNS